MILWSIIRELKKNRENMPRFNLNQLSPKNQKELLDEFYLAVASLETIKEVKIFFKELLSVSEVVMLARRLLVAQMLISGLTFEEISERMGMGMDTIAHVQRWIVSGEGHKTAVKRLEGQKDRKERKKISLEEKYDPFGWYSIKKKYPAHFWPEKAVKEVSEILERYAKKQKKKKSIRNYYQRVKAKR
ncbi:MAG: hypothetical protein COX43_01640 [Parcubacteria group bacterium CG23_combo_of_CG06-09_8_20_14_all_35_9]|nr:MAG: hypothetical protein COX43_01640 [Parcubacteria group bacterium CG23_combo_of_CG06-09_8_20_14_all_35_9]